MTGFMAQSAKIDRIGLNHDIAHFGCDLNADSNFSIKAIIGGRCSPSDLIYIHDYKRRLLTRKLE